MEQKYRHEFKYPVTIAQINILTQKLDGLIPRDSHVNQYGMYNIRSIYFDDFYNRCFYENENGADPREKFRIRIYNNSDKRISLECKRKERGKTLKTSCILTKEQCNLIISGGVPTDFANQNQLLNKLAIQMLNNQMRPVIIVDYDRIPYVYDFGNVRITFDMNVSSSTQIANFFDKDIVKRAVMPSGQHLMEVKWDEYLPQFIYDALALDSLQQTAYSKYYLCRLYNL